MLAMSAGMFTSCDDEIEDDNTPSGNVTKKQKHLVSIKKMGRSPNTTYISYSYDANGKMADMSHSEIYRPQSFLKDPNYTTIGDNVFNYYAIGTTSKIQVFTNFNSDGTILENGLKFYTLNDSLKFGSSTIFEYDAEGHIVSSINSDVLTGKKGDDYDCQWTWQNEDIVSLSEVDGRNPSSKVTWTYKYTNDEYPTPIENKTDVLFFANNSNITSFCNRFGTPCKHLPVYIVNGSGYGQRVVWTFDEDGYPIKEELYWADTNGNYIYETDGSKYVLETTYFVWE